MREPGLCLPISNVSWQGSRWSILIQPTVQGYGVYRFESKYGANVDGYSPIYTPDQWTDDGQVYKLGTKGLLAW